MARKQRGGDMGFTDWFFVLGLFVTVLAIVLGVLWGAGVFKDSETSNTPDPATGTIVPAPPAPAPPAPAPPKTNVVFPKFNITSTVMSFDHTTIDIYYTNTNISSDDTGPYKYKFYGYLTVTFSNSTKSFLQLQFSNAVAIGNGKFTIPVLTDNKLDPTKIKTVTLDILLKDVNNYTVPLSEITMPVVVP